MSVLLDALKPSRPQDKVQDALDAVTPEEYEALKSALVGRTFTGRDIANALTAAGYPVTPGQVNHFRRKITDGKVTL